MLAVTCPHCKYHLRLSEHLRGKKVSCMICKGEFRLSAGEPAEEDKLAPVNVASPPVKPRDPLPPRRRVSSWKRLTTSRLCGRFALSPGQFALLCA